jgi:hypothetical protein
LLSLIPLGIPLELKGAILKHWLPFASPVPVLQVLKYAKPFGR